MTTTRETALVQWINTVDGLSATCASFEELHDGVLLSEVLGQAAPSDMATEDIDDLPATTEAKAKNIKTIVSALASFYNDTFGTTDSFGHIDVDAIAAGGDAAHEPLHALLELVLGCVINCSDKALYIEGIQMMDPAQQTQIMHVIQDVMDKYAEGVHNESLDESFATNASGFTPMPQRSRASTGGEDEDETHSLKMHALANASTAELRALKGQVGSLQQELATKTDEANGLAAEVQALRQEMQDAAKREKAKELEKIKMIKTAMSQREVEISGGLRDLESRCAQLEQANALLQRQLQQKNSSWKEKMQAQEDELAILRSSAAAAGRAEQLQAKLARRDTDMNQLREHLKALEDQNLKLEDRNGTLQAEISKIPPLERQLQTYRDKLTVSSATRACLPAWLWRQSRPRKAHNFALPWFRCFALFRYFFHCCSFYVHLLCGRLGPYPVATIACLSMRAPTQRRLHGSMATS